MEVLARPLLVMIGLGLDDTMPFFGTNVETGSDLMTINGEFGY